MMILQSRVVDGGDSGGEPNLLYHYPDYQI